MKLYTIDEIEFLKNNFDKGVKYCAEQLDRTHRGIIQQLKKMKLVVNNNKYTKEEITNLLNNANSISDIIKNLGISESISGGSYRTIHKYVKLYNLENELIKLREREYNNRVKKLNNRKHLLLSDILVENSNYSRGSLKNRLYKEGLKERKCEKCGQDEYWFGKKMSLILDHINGIFNDNRIENLQILCPNCNATTETFCRKSQYNKNNDDLYEYTQDNFKKIQNDELVITKINNIEQEIKISGKYSLKNICGCGNLIGNTSNKCLSCYQIESRRVERPPLDILLKEVDDMGYSAIGRKYGVSDNAIRKWIKNYNKK